MPIYRVPDEHRERVRYHLGYLNIEPVAAISFGFPASTQESLAVERAMDRLMSAQALRRVTDILDTLDDIECRQRGALKQLGVQSIEGIKFRNSNDEATVSDLLQNEYVRWRTKLAMQLGVTVAPWADANTPINHPVATII